MSDHSIKDLVNQKRDNWTIQLRKQKREEEFRLKRVIKVSPKGSPDLDVVYLQHITEDKEKLSEVILALMQDVKDLYQDLPASMTKITQKIRRIRKLHIEETDFISQLILRNEFIRIMAIFLGEQFTYMQELQEECGWLLSNFMGSMGREDIAIYSDYSIQLRLIAKEFLNNFKRFIRTKNDKQIEIALYCFGNMMTDHFEIFMDFIQEDGFQSLLQLAQSDVHSELILWIFMQNFQGSNTLSIEQTVQLVPFVDHMMDKPIHDIKKNCLIILASMSEKGDYSEMVLSVSKFSTIITLMNSPYQELSNPATQIVSNLCWTEQVQEMVLTTDILNIFEVKLSSFGEEPKTKVLYGLENLIYQSSVKVQQAIISQTSLVEKIMSCGYLTSLNVVIGVCQFLLAAFEVDEDQVIITTLVGKGLISLISHLLNHQRDQILLNVMPLIGSVIDLNAKQCLGANPLEGVIMKIMSSKQIFEKVYHIYSNSNNPKIVDMSQKVINSCVMADES